MAKIRHFVLITLLLTSLAGCRDDLFEKFKRPVWLQGKLYSQIREQADLSTFARCLELTGYDTIINVSGSYTVFAPTNEAFNLFFRENTKYQSVEQIPMPELVSLVKFHIIQNPWSKIQLRSLDVYGWIDSLDITNNKPAGFKRETLLLNKNLKVGVTRDKDKNYQIIDTLTSRWNRVILTDSRKFAPVFYKEYFDIYNKKITDYSFYFNRSFENSTDIFYVNSRILGEEIPAENGFVYKVDRVVEPLKNGYEILSNSQSAHSYSDFLNLINKFPDFVFNEEETNNQPGAEEGMRVDSLFDVSFPALTFNIFNERTRAPSGTFGLPNNVSIRYHYGLMAPTNEAFRKFLDEYINGINYWGNLDNAPLNIKRIIVNSYMADQPIYLSDITNGFNNGEKDLVKLNEADIVQKQFGSNCSFIGLKNPVIPRAFISVTGPIYRQQRFSLVMNAIEKSGLLPALKREDQYYTLFVENDFDLSADSSLMYNPIRDEFFLFQLSPGGGTRMNVGIKDLRTLILNHVGTQKPTGLARKEFIRNLAGNYLIFNNETGEVSGTAPTTQGYNGTFVVKVIPHQISTNADNGTTYEISDWFSFGGTDIYSRISSNFPKFHQLLINAGLALPKEFRYSFLSDNENYTIFIPTEAALSQYNTGGLTKEQLRKFLMMHFVQGALIFTDGSLPSGYYETTRIDEKSTQYSTVNTSVYIQTGYDHISLKDKAGNQYVEMDEKGNRNIMATRTLGDGSQVFPSIVTNAVIHEIDRVLLFSDLDTK